MSLQLPTTRRRHLPAAATIAVLTLVLLTGGCATHRTGSAGPAAPPSSAPAPTAAVASPSPTAGPVGHWQWLSASPLPSGTYRSVWTGREMILYAPNMTAPAESTSPVGSTAAAYNPTTGTWRTLPSSGLPIRAAEGGWHPVWDGTEMLTFGLMDAAYNPTTNRWRPLHSSPIYGASVTVWTGSEVLMWGGGCCDSANADGAAYTPATDTWQPMPAAPLSGRYTPAAWTGTELVIAGGWAPEENGLFADAAAYNPASRTWRTLPPLPQPRAQATLTWTGTEVLVVGGQPGPPGSGYADGLAYNPTTNRWRQLPTMDSTRMYHVAVWTGTRLIVWGGQTAQRMPPAHGESYDPVTDRWTPLPPSVLNGRTAPNAVWTGRAMLIWGGISVLNPTACMDGASYIPG